MSIPKSSSLPHEANDFVVRFDGPHAGFEVREPESVTVAYTPDHAWALLAAADESLANGCGVALFASYEFGYACSGAARPHRSETLAPFIPLICLAVFDPASMQSPRSFPPIRERPEIRFEAATSYAAYAATLAEIYRELHAGNVYQLNYTVPFVFDFAGDPLELYAHLAPLSHAPERAYFAYSNFAVAAISPELFLEFTPDSLITKPMKGTATPERASELTSPKNRAEHVMIVDLLRNDLAQVCDDVRVDALFQRETYPTFVTMTSTIRGRRRPHTGLGEIFRALFPCGSITGAPKFAAMTKIAQFETVDRGAYCGTVGYVLPDGTGRLNVAIRTLQCDRLSGRGRLDLGGGIVADSQPAAEWHELGVKGRLFTALGPVCARNSEFVL